MSVLVVLEHDGERWHPAAKEALAAGGELGERLSLPVEAVIAGHGLDALAREAATWPARRIHLLDAEPLALYTPDLHTAALEALIKAVEPQFVVFPHTYQTRDFAPKLATRFSRALVSDVVGFRFEGEAPRFLRQIFQGKLLAEMRVEARPVFVSVQAGAFRSGEGAAGSAEVVPFPVVIDAGLQRTRPSPPYQETGGAVDLSAAERIVAAGRGVREREDLELIERLAAALGAELAASRPLCDNGWLPMERQVGSSGQTVSPQLYVAVGVSGAIQHLVGMKGAKTIVAINKDPDAPIFEAADYGIVGDLYEVVPALIEALEAR